MKTITEMAREADLDWQKHWDNEGNRLERFAALVRADECDRMCKQFNISKELAHEKAKGNETD